MARFRLLRLLPAPRHDDAGRLEGPHRRRRRDLLRRGRLAGYGARSHLAMAIADPVPPRIRTVREPAPRPPDAGNRKSVVEGKGWSRDVDFGGRRYIKKQKQ